MARTKAEQAQLDNYLGCNYTRREVLLARYGYVSQEEYFKAMGHTPKYVRKPKGTAAPAAPVKKTTPVKAKKVSKKTVVDEHPIVDMVIAFDTTGSMTSYIGDVKEHVQTLIPELLFGNPNLKLKIVAFGDYCDMPSKEVFGSAYQEIELTDNENALINFVKRAKSTGGGDNPEFYELVIRKINRETKWREGSTKAVLFIADDTPHNVGYSYGNIVKINTIDWKKECEEAKSLGIMYDTLSIRREHEWFYKSIAEITGGTHLPFQSSGKTKQVVEASTLLRSSKSGFEKKMAETTLSGDAEMIGVYKKLSSTLKD
jgi:hypothetical protein